MRTMFSFLKSGFQKIKKALSKTHGHLTMKIRGLFGRPLDDASIDELEKILFEADIGSACTQLFIDDIQKFAKKHPKATPEDYLSEFKSFAKELLFPSQKPRPTISATPHLILIVGVNGGGKTTTCAKLANIFKAEGHQVLLAAADTFRAAAIDQLEIWANRLNLDIVKGQPGGDPSSVIYDALIKAKSKGHTVVIADTAGRLQSKTDLMHELEKIRRVAEKAANGAPHETLLVLDATTGQNAIDQAKVFHEFTPLSGIILTKLDGSAKGGVAISISHNMKLPIYYIGVGESLDDLIAFNYQEYVDALFS